MADDRYDRVTFHGKTVDKYTRAALLACEAELKYNGGLTIIQGSYNGGVSASAGTHDGGGAVDLAPYDWVRKVKVLRANGFAAWHRPTLKGYWSEHIHAIQIDNTAASPAAKRQVVDYRRGLNGLANKGRDTDARPKVIKAFDYPTSKPAPVKPAPVPVPAPAKPAPKPAPTTPAPSKDVWTLTEWNIAGMNALGKLTVNKRNPNIVDALDKSGGDIIAINELADPNVGLFTSLMMGKGFKRIPGGSDGRYIFARNEVKVGKSGVFDLQPRYKGDDKQAAWAAVFIGGTWKLIVVPHLEYRKGADNERVGQAKSMIAQARSKCQELGILWKHIIYAGDVNSDSWVTVKAFGPSGFVDVFTKAVKTLNAARKSFTSWTGRIKNGKHIDVVAVHKDGPKVLVADLHIGSRTTLKWMASDHLMTIVTFQG